MRIQDLLNPTGNAFAELFRRQQGGPAPRMNQGKPRDWTTQEKLDTAATTTMALPVVGDVAGLAADAHMYANDPASRNLMNYVMTAAGMLPFVPAASQARKVADKITAYHGSPHDFDEFKLDKIGTGEGAQAYGHGLYFAESEDVARQYRDQLADFSKGTVNDEPIGQLFERIQRQSEKLPVDSDEYVELTERLSFLEDLDQGISFNEALGQVDVPSVADWAKSEIEPNYVPAGNIYQVEIDATPDELLDWDAPLSEQPEKVRQAYAQAIGEMDDVGRRVGQQVIDDDHVGASAIKFLSDTPQGKEGGTQMLKKAGIKGIKYKDGFSRGAEGGTSNYVIFDDRLISISKKYGIAIPAAAALLAKQTGEDTEGSYKEI